MGCALSYIWMPKPDPKPDDDSQKHPNTPKYPEISPGQSPEPASVTPVPRVVNATGAAKRKLDLGDVLLTFDDMADDDIRERLKDEGVADLDQLASRDELTRALRETLDTPKVILVVGQAGDGKSTLVNALRDHEAETQQCAVGLMAGGVTKDVTSYIGKRIDGRAITILDTPGIGDYDVKAPQLLSMIQAKLKKEKGSAIGGIHGIVVTSKVSDGRVLLGGQLVRELVNTAFLSDTDQDNWSSVILCGTKKDEAQQKYRDIFCADMDELDPQGRKAGVVADFFQSAEDGWGKYAMVSKDDYSELIGQIECLPNEPISCKDLSSVELAEVISSVAGGDPEAIRNDLNEEMAKRLEEQKVEQEKQRIAERLKEAQTRDQEIARVKKESAHAQEQLTQEMNKQLADVKKDAKDAHAEREKLTKDFGLQITALNERQAEKQQKIAEAYNVKHEEILKEMEMDREKHAAEVKKLQDEKDQAEKDAEEKREKDVQEARDALAKAMSDEAEDVDAINAAVKSMVQLGLDDDSEVNKAGVLLRKLAKKEEAKRVEAQVDEILKEKERKERETKRVKNVALVKKRLNKLTKEDKTENENAIEETLAQARELGLGEDEDEDVKAAHKALKKIKAAKKKMIADRKEKQKTEEAARRKLDDAVSERVIDNINSAIKTMKSLGLGDHPRVLRANEVIQEIKEKAQRETTARDALQKAIDARKADAINAALGGMTILGLTGGVDFTLIKVAEQVKREIQAAIQADLDKEKKRLERLEERRIEAPQVTIGIPHVISAPPKPAKNPNMEFTPKKKKMKNGVAKKSWHGPRCNDGTLNMKFKENRGMDKYFH